MCLQVAGNPLPESNQPSSQLESPRGVSRSGTSRDLPNPSRIGDVQVLPLPQLIDIISLSSSTAGKGSTGVSMVCLQETIFENEELATRDLNGSAPYRSSSHKQKRSPEAHADLTVMLSFMEDQWSKASLLAKDEKGPATEGGLNS